MTHKLEITDLDNFVGICVSPKLKFNTENGCSANVLDRLTPTNKFNNIHTFENVSDQIPIGQVEKSRYCLITNEDFECINFTKPK